MIAWLIDAPARGVFDVPGAQPATVTRNSRASACGPSEAPGSPTRQPRWGGPPEGSPAKPGRRVRASGGGAPRAVENEIGQVGRVGLVGRVGQVGAVAG